MSKSFWQGQRWLVFWVYVGLVLATLPIARDVTLTLRNNNLLGATVTATYGVAFALVVYHVFFDLRHADWIAFLVVALLISVIAGLLLGLSIPEERVHFLQYGLMSLLAHRAFSLAAVPRIACAAALTSALGFLDELLQGLLPSRYFDWRDVGMNAAAAVIALALDELLHDRTALRARAFAKGGGPT